MHYEVVKCYLVRSVFGNPFYQIKNSYTFVRQRVLFVGAGSNLSLAQWQFMNDLNSINLSSVPKSQSQFVLKHKGYVHKHNRAYMPTKTYFQSRLQWRKSIFEKKFYSLLSISEQRSLFRSFWLFTVCVHFNLN